MDANLIDRVIIFVFDTISYLKQIVAQLGDASTDFCVMASLILFFSLVFIQILAPARGYAMGSDQLRQEKNLKLERENLKTRQGSESTRREKFEERKGEELVDYCAILGEDDIQGKKHGFLAGNKVFRTQVSLAPTHVRWLVSKSVTLSDFNRYLRDGYSNKKIKKT